MEYQERDVVLCVVEKIVGTTVFVNIEKDKEGTINFSEIAPGRIRNIRDYVSPGKRIVCKILRINSDGNLNLSLRRVTSKEKKEIMDNYEKERTAISILKKIIGIDANKIIKEIQQKENSVYSFLHESKEDKRELEKYVGKDKVDILLKILNEKKEKFKEIKKEFFLKCKKDNGIEKIKNILSKYEELICYLGAGKFSITKKSVNFKQTEKEIEEILKEIEEKAKIEKCDFEIN